MKTVSFNIDPHIIQYESTIRGKYQIIKLIIKISEFLLYSNIKQDIINENDNDKIGLIICADKMNRVLICEKNKKVSFQFPFNIKFVETKISISYKSIDINNKILSILAAAFKNMTDFSSVCKIIENYWDINADFGINDYDNTDDINCKQLITYLLSFEPGYLRFEHDIVHEKVNHPLNHIDIYYSDNNKFKIELNTHISYETLIDILNVKTTCYKLEKLKQ